MNGALKAKILASNLTGFQRKVLLETCRIPKGKTITYGELARRMGRAGAARAVGNALAKNPFPIVVPCHRVVAKDGIGGYSGGVGMKKKLLLKEKKRG